MKKTIYIRSIGLFICILSLLFSAVVYILSKSVLLAVLTNFLVMNLYTVFLTRTLLSHRELRQHRINSQQTGQKLSV